MKDNCEDIIYETVQVNKKRRLIISIAVTIALILAALSVIIALAYVNANDKGSFSSEGAPSNPPSNTGTLKSETPEVICTPPASPHADVTRPPSFYEDYKKMKAEEAKFDLIVDYLKKAGSFSDGTWSIYLTTTPAIFLSYGYSTYLERDALNIGMAKANFEDNTSLVQGITLVRGANPIFCQTVLLEGEDERCRLLSTIENKSEYTGGLGTVTYDGPSDYNYYMRTQAAELIKELLDNIDDSFSMHGLDVKISELGFSSYDK